MTKPDSQSMNYRLLKIISRQPLKFGRFFAGLLAGLINYVKISKTTRTVELNLKIALPQLDQKQRLLITQQAIRNELSAYFEFFSIWGSTNEKNISRIHHIYGEQLFHNALAEKKGLVLIVPHFGTWEAMNAWCAQYTQMTILYKPVKNHDADCFVREARSREQAILVPTNETGVRQIFKALKQGQTTVILPDHTPNQGGDMVPYFGVPLASSSLTAKLLQKTQAKALLLYAIRNDQDGFDMYIEPIDGKIYHGNAEDGTRVIHHTIEQLIQRYPEHYHWSYKRFKAHPELRDVYNIPHETALEKINQIRQNAQLSDDTTTV